MKILRLLSIFILMGCMLLVSCQKDNDENDPSQESIITRDEDGRFWVTSLTMWQKFYSYSPHFDKIDYFCGCYVTDGSI